VPDPLYCNPSAESFVHRVCQTVAHAAGMATIFSLAMTMGSGTSSIAVKAGTNTPLTRTTMWTAVARRRPAGEDPLGERLD
jgi:hypothetical protein